MPRIWENKESRALAGETIRFSYEIREVPELDDAVALLLATAPLSVFGWNGAALRRQPPDVEPLNGRGMWRGVVSYAPGGSSSNEFVVNFNITTESQHITQALETVAQYVPQGKQKANYFGAIGVEGADVKGVDIPVSKFSFGWTIYKPKELVTIDYVKALSTMVGCFNASTFLEFPRGELLLRGVSGSRRQKADDWELNCEFEHSANAGDFQIGDINVGSKLGHDYLWVAYEEAVDDTAKVALPKPRQVNVERVLREADFSPLGISVT